MPLEDLSLSALERTNLGKQFSEALAAIEDSFEKDADVAGERSINIKMSFNPTDGSYVSVLLACSYATPRRKVKTIGTITDGILKIDTISNDVRQPDLLDSTKIINFKEAQGGK